METEQQIPLISSTDKEREAERVERVIALTPVNRLYVRLQMRHNIENLIDDATVNLLVDFVRVIHGEMSLEDWTEAAQMAWLSVRLGADNGAAVQQ